MQINLLSSFRQLKKNRINLALNLTGLIAAFLVCASIMMNAWQQFNTDRFIPEANRIYRLNCGGYGVTPPCFKDIIGNRIPEIEECCRLNARDLEITFENQPLKLNSVCLVDSNFLGMFGIRLVQGSSKTALAGSSGIILSESLAMKIFGSTHVIGKTITHNRKFVFTVTGVMSDLPANSHLKINGLIPFQALPVISDHNERPEDCGSWSQLTYLKLSGSGQRTSCENKINALLEDYKMGTRDGKIPLRLEAITSIYFDGDNNKFDGSLHGNLIIILAFTALGVLTLLIAFITSVNFSLAKSEERMKEVLIRRIYGASGLNITFLFTMEITLVFVIAFFLASAIFEVFRPFMSAEFGFLAGDTVTRTRFYILSLCVIFALGILAGMITALYTRIQYSFENAGLHHPPMKRKSRGVFMILVQYSLAALFLSSTYISSGQLRFLVNKDSGFRPENVIQIELDQVLSGSSDYLKKRLLKVPGVQMLGFSDSWIGEGFGKRPSGEKGKEILCNFFSVDPDYLGVMGISMAEGENYSWLNSADSSGSIILNETAAKAFELSPATGKIFQKQIIAGIAKDFQFQSFKNSAEPVLIQRLKDKPRILSIKLGKQKQTETIGKIVEICREISPQFHNRFSLVADSLGKYYSEEIRLSRGIGLYALIALVLSIIGIAGISLIRVQKKRKEIAIRRILGSSIPEISSLIIREFIPWVAVANFLSIPVIIYVSKLWFQTYANHIGISALPFILTLVVTAGITIIVILLITYRACRAIPAEVLREE